MRDGTPVYANSHIGGLAELMVTFEEWVVPIFTKATAADLGMVCSCVTVAGLGATTSQTLALVRARLDRRRRRLRTARAERRAGREASPARRRSSPSIPIRARREVALKTRRHARARSQRRGRQARRPRARADAVPNNRLWAGGRDAGGLLGGAGADFVIEAVGADAVPPKLEAGPDPTGILPMRQAYEMTRARRPRRHDQPAAREHHAAGRAVLDRRPHAPRRTGRRLATRCATSRASSRCSTRAVQREGARHDGRAGSKACSTAYEEVAYRTTVTAIMTP